MELFTSFGRVDGFAHTALFYGVIGFFVGSFLNVCIVRIPQGASIMFPPSHCPVCKTRLRAADLIPVLSYLLLKGRCRECGSPISVQYPIVEFLTGVCFFLAARWSVDYLHLYKFLFFVSCLVVIFFIDLRHYVIPDVIVLPGIEAGLLLAVFEGRFWDAVFGCAAGGAIFLLIAYMAVGLFRREGMGGGDVKFAGMIGAFLGIKLMLLAAFLSFLAGGLAVIPMLFLGIRKMGEPVPFGPMMVAGAFAAMFFGERILELYLGLW
ncbi:MAG: prepilin peptidase [bacterium]